MEKKQKNGMNLIQKLYHFRLKIDRKGTPIVNLSSLFCIPCLLFAPHMSIAGIIVSLILGYHISLESDGDTGDLEETLRNAAETVKRTATSAASAIRQEIDKARGDQTPAARSQAEGKTANAARSQAEEITVNAAPASPVNEEIVEDLKKEADSVYHGNPGIYHTAFSAVAGSVPTLQVPSEDTPDEPAASQNAWQN